MNTKRILAILLAGSVCLGSLFVSASDSERNSTNDMVKVAPTVASTTVPDEEIIYTNVDRMIISRGAYYAYAIKKVYLSERKDYILYILSDSELNIIHWEGNGEDTIVIPDSIGGAPVKSVVIYADIGFKNVVLADGIESFAFDEEDESGEYLPGYDMFSTIESFTLGKSFKGLPKCTWGTFDSLKEVNVSKENETIKSIDGVVFSKNGKTLLFYPPAKGSKYTIPKETKTIDENAFLGSTTLKKITLNKGLKKIGDYAFKDVLNLREITMPANVKKIGENAFYDCKKLKKVVLKSKKTKLTERSGIIFNDDSDNFGEGKIVKNMTIKAPAGSTAKKLAKYDGVKFVPLKR